MNSLVGTTISSLSSDYKVEAELCRCRFGVVFQCHKELTKKTVVLKVFEDTVGIKFAKQEVEILKILKGAGSKDFNIVTLTDAFMLDGRYCVEFEKLDVSLKDYVKEKPLTMKEIRPILYQLLQALNFLGSRNIVHADIKSSHIMMVDPLRQPLRIKLISFGFASTGPASWSSEKVKRNIWEDYGYKAPEMLEGIEYDQRADMYGLGSVAVEMMTGFPLFSAQNMYNLVPTEAAGESEEAEECDRMVFIDLLTKMFEMDPAQRITPGEALEDPFFTMSQLKYMNNPNYLKLSTELMKVCDKSNVEEEGFPGCSTSIPTKKSRIDSVDNRPGTKKKWSNNLTKRYLLFLVFAILALFAFAKLDILLPFFTGSGRQLLFTEKNISQRDFNTSLIALEFLHNPKNSGLMLHPSKRKRKLVKLATLPTGVQPTPVNRFLEIVWSVLIKMDEMLLKTTDHCVTLLTETWRNNVTPEVSLYTSYVVVTVIALLWFQSHNAVTLF